MAGPIDQIVVFVVVPVFASWNVKRIKSPWQSMRDAFAGDAA